MKTIVLFTLAAALQGAAFAQKAQNPELREKHAANSVTAEPRKSGSVAAAPVKSNSASELAKIEQSGIKNIKPARNSNAAHLPARTETAAPGKNKSAKFSYHPPQGGSKGRSNGGRAAAAARPPKALQ